MAEGQQQQQSTPGRRYTHSPYAPTPKPKPTLKPTHQSPAQSTGSPCVLTGNSPPQFPPPRPPPNTTPRAIPTATTPVPDRALTREGPVPLPTTPAPFIYHHHHHHHHPHPNPRVLPQQRELAPLQPQHPPCEHLVSWLRLRARKACGRGFSLEATDGLNLKVLVLVAPAWLLAESTLQGYLRGGVEQQRERQPPARTGNSAAPTRQPDAGDQQAPNGPPSHYGAVPCGHLLHWHRQRGRSPVWRMRCTHCEAQWAVPNPRRCAPPLRSNPQSELRPLVAATEEAETAATDDTTDGPSGDARTHPPPLQTQPAAAPPDPAPESPPPRPPRPQPSAPPPMNIDHRRKQQQQQAIPGAPHDNDDEADEGEEAGEAATGRPRDPRWAFLVDLAAGIVIGFA